MNSTKLRPMSAMRRRHSRRRTKQGVETIAGFIDQFSGVLILSSLVFAPWAFGTVHDWSINVMNSIGFLLGLLLLLSFAIQGQLHDRTRPAASFKKSELLLVLTAMMSLAYIAVHALNARASFDAEKLLFSFRDNFVLWLPHTYDVEATWSTFLRFLALSLGFFSTIAWLKRSPRHLDSAREELLPTRIRTLLLVICISSGLMALVGLLQRLDSSPNLLWILTPHFNRVPEYNFGPFAYRGNAATYFNLAWPLGIFLFIRLRKTSILSGSGIRVGSTPHLVLIPFIGLILAAPLITSSRAGIAVLLFQTVLVGSYYLAIKKVSRARLITFLFSILVFIGLGLAIAWEFGGLGRIVSTLSSFEPKTYQNYQEESRMDIYHNLLPTARQIPTWGFGPGSFAAVYLLQRGPVLVHGDNTELVKWSAWAHCDPLEFFITFGVVGSILLVLFLGVAVGRPLFFSIKSHAENDLFVPYIALSGCLLHSFVDFPFQIYSLVHLFLAILAITWVAAESTNSLTLPHAPATERS